MVVQLKTVANEEERKGRMERQFPPLLVVAINSVARSYIFNTMKCTCDLVMQSGKPLHKEPEKGICIGCADLVCHD